MENLSAHDVYWAGHDAYYAGTPCPHKSDTLESIQWNKGWRSANMTEESKLDICEEDDECLE